MLLLQQSVLRLQNTAPQSALNDNDLCGFRIKQMKSQKKMLSSGLLIAKIKKAKNTPKLETEKIHLQRYQCICSSFTLLISWGTCMCQAGCWTWWVFDLNQYNLRRYLVVGEGTTGESVSYGYRKMVVWYSWCSLIHTCFLLLPATGQQWVPKDSLLTQGEPVLFSMWVLRIPFDMLEVSGKREYKEKKSLAQMQSVLQIAHEWRSTDLLQLPQY